MKRIFQISLLVLVAVAFSSNAQAQEDKSKRPSPPAVAEGKVDGVNIKIDYSSPAVKGRTVWGELVPYGKVWRTGANEATTIETDGDIRIEGMPLPKGRYAIFSVPNEKSWEIRFNSEADQWGAYRYDESKDVLRVDVAPQAASEFAERLKFDVGKGMIVITWENVSVPIKVSK